MKVVQILPSLQSGGVEVGTLEIAKALVEHGHQSLVISAGGPMVERLESEGSQHVTWNLGKKSPLSFRHIWRLRRWFEQEQPDIVHVRSRMPAWIAYLAWRGMKASSRPRFISTMHGLHSVSRYSEIMCRGERVIAVSQTVKDYIAVNYPNTDMTKVQLINRGVAAEEYPRPYQPSEAWLKAWQSSFPQLQDKRILCLPGRLTRLKGHTLFIELIEALREEFDDIHGLIVGAEDPKRQAYAQELYQLVEDKQLAPHITFTGGRGDMKEIYSQSAMVLSLSTKPESFGRTTTEALSMGVPVVGFDHGGVGEQLSTLFEQGKVPCFDQAALQQRVEALLRKPHEPKANTVYLKSKMIAQTLQLYSELLAETETKE